MGRVAAWAVVWTVVISLAAAPFVPDPLEREIEADNPASSVRYLGPVSRQDYGGFAPSDDPDGVFTVAWIGGSEIKLNSVSVAGEVSNRIATFGGQRVQIDAYSVIAPRPIDALRAMDAAIANGADAIVVTLNTAWVSDEWSMRDWPNMDVSAIGTLLAERSLWPWAATLTSPADVAWRVTRALSPVVESQLPLNSDLAVRRDELSVVVRSDDNAEEEPADLDPRLPADQSDFWLIQEFGPHVLDSFERRVAALVRGLDDDQPTADFFAQEILGHAHDADVPAFIYPTPINPSALDSDEFRDAAMTIEQFWRRQAASIDSPLVELESRLLSRDLPDGVEYYDIVHMADAAPMAELLVPRLCDNWKRANPEAECA